MTNKMSTVQMELKPKATAMSSDKRRTSRLSALLLALLWPEGRGLRAVQLIQFVILGVIDVGGLWFGISINVMSNGYQDLHSGFVFRVKCHFVPFLIPFSFFTWRYKRFIAPLCIHKASPFRQHSIYRVYTNGIYAMSSVSVCLHLTDWVSE